MQQRIPAIALTLAVLAAAPSFADRKGAVYAMTDALDGNEIVVYERAKDGTLTFADQVATGGRGVGDTTAPGDALGSQGPLILSKDRRWLFAVNAKSNSISSFRAQGSNLTLVDEVHSGGQNPASLTQYKNLLYVLNSGGQGNITGFTRGNNGSLTPIAGSTRKLMVGGDNPPFFLVSPAQVSFTPSGSHLVVTIKGSNEIRVWRVGADGLPSASAVSNISNGNTPFSFSFTRNGHLLVAEAFGNNPVGTGAAGAVSSYRVNADGSLKLLSASVDNFQTAACWLVTQNRSRYAYVTNNLSDTVTGYKVNRSNGRVRLLDADGVTGVTGFEPVDVSMTRNGRFLYVTNAGDGTVSAFRVLRSGALIPLQEIGGLPAEDGAVGSAAQ